MSFTNFISSVQKQLSTMAKTGLFEVSLNKDVVYDTYQNSFPEGTNKIYKERREYDCNCCKQFIRDLGRVVTFVDGKKTTIWDIKVDGYYQVVADAMAALIRSAPVENEFLHFQAKVGTAESHVLNENDLTTTTFHHFNAVLPKQFVKPGKDIPTLLNDSRGNVKVLERSLKEFSSDAAETILELIAQNSLYRGKEKESLVKTFLDLKTQYDAFSSEEQKEAFIWTKAKELGAFAKVRNDAIGTLLENLSKGKDLEESVKIWESVMAPTNYKRPTALVTESMIKKAQEKVLALGYQDSLPRRYAVLEDIRRNNVLFADRSTHKTIDPFGGALDGVAKAPVKGPSNVEEISIEDFIKNVLPKTESLEVFVGNPLASNLMSLVAPVYPDAPNMLKWDNNFSWSYKGEVTDSIKERVKAAGGNVTGDLRVSLSWYNPDDLDLHIKEPAGGEIYFGQRRGSSGGVLDVDMNAYGKSDDFHPVENVTWDRASNIPEGVYKVIVHNYNRRLSDRVGFEVELEFKGEVLTFAYPKAVADGKKVEVVKFKYSHAKGVEVLDSIGHTKLSKEVWGISTEQFQKVSLVMKSPNHWDENKVGNKHYFFILEGCNNPEATRGFYNEYLSNDLSDHRKVFEQLGSKMKVAKSDRQLSGLGFSETVSNELLVKVTGQFTRTLKIKF